MPKRDDSKGIKLEPRRKRAKKPKVLSPVGLNGGWRGADYTITANPLTPAKAPKHPYYNRKRFDITNYVESFTWSSDAEQSGIISGTITVRNPGNVLGVLVPGSRLSIKVVMPWVQSGSQSFEDWRKKPKRRKFIEFIVQNRTKDNQEFLMELECVDATQFLNKGEKDFKYVKGKKKHKKGWTASEIIIDICKKNNIPYNKQSIPKTKIYIPKVTAEKTTILAFIKKVLKKHNELSNKKKGKTAPPVNWDVNMRAGVLTVTPRKRPAAAWLISEQYLLTEPSYSENSEKIITQVSVRAKYKKDKKKDTKKKKKKQADKQTNTGTKGKKAKKKKVLAVARDEKMIKVFGLRNKYVDLPGDITNEKAKDTAFSELSRLGRMKREFEFSCPALHGIWAGSQVRLHAPTYGLIGFFTVKSVQYDISGSDGPSMSITVDAGSAMISAESAPKLIKVKRVEILSDMKTVKVYYADGSVRQRRTGNWKVLKTDIIREDDVADSERPFKGETVVITYTNKKKRRVPNRVQYPSGLVVVTEEGYIPSKLLNEGV